MSSARRWRRAATSASTPRTTATGMPLDLPMTSSAADGQLVGDGHLGHLHDAAEGVGGAPQIDHAGDPGHADGHVGQALAPRPPERVATR